MTAVRPVGVVTRGTTAARRLRRVDRWILATHHRVLAATDPVVVDLGFGARPVTTVELAARLRKHVPAARVIGLASTRSGSRRRAPTCDPASRSTSVASSSPDTVRIWCAR